MHRVLREGSPGRRHQGQLVFISLMDRQERHQASRMIWLENQTSGWSWWMDSVTSPYWIGSMVSTITSQYWNENFPDQPVHPLDDLLTLSGAGGSEIPYRGYVEVDTKLPGLDASPFPFLVVGETEYNSRVPVLIGTNILNKILDGLVNAHGVRFAQKASLPSAMNCALSVIQTARKTLGKRKNVISEVHLCETTELAPGEGRRVSNSMIATSNLTF